MAAISPSRISRVALILPVALVLLLGLGWSGFWFYVQGRVDAGLDGFLEREAEAGRSWSCDGRSIGGFPFRIEIACAGLSLKRPKDPSAPALTFGRALAVAQIYDPGLVIGEFSGPLGLIWSDTRKAELVSKTARFSLRRAGNAPEQGALVIEAPVLTLHGFDALDGTARAARLEVHARVAPSRPAEERAGDLSLDLKGLEAAGLDQAFGGKEPADIALETTVLQLPVFAAGVTPVTLEAWRTAGGALDMTRLAFRKGKAEVESRGRFAFDEARRPTGKLEGAQTGIDRIAGVNVGPMLDAGGLFAGKPATKTEGGRTLKPLPPLEARNGRVYLGPLRVPGLDLKPLY